MLLLLARSKPRPLTLIRPLMSTSALRSAILQGPAPGKTPLTMFSLTLGNVPSGFTGPAPFATGMTPMPPSNLARNSRSCEESCAYAPTGPTIPKINRIAAAVFFISTFLTDCEFGWLRCGNRRRCHRGLAVLVGTTSVVVPHLRYREHAAKDDTAGGAGHRPLAISHDQPV